MSKHVAVLMGGLSNERPVSLSSGKQCAQALRNAGYQVTELDVGFDIAERLRALKPDVAFNALHGPYGEDGTIQGVLEFLRVPYTHSGVLASALAMDKHQAKIMFKAAGIPVTDHLIANAYLGYSNGDKNVTGNVFGDFGLLYTFNNTWAVHGGVRLNNNNTQTFTLGVRASF